MNPLTIDHEFLLRFKQRTEAKWNLIATNPQIYGFQFQRGTRWHDGLAEKQVRDYEEHLKAQFPSDFRQFLLHMNGTDLPTLNVYGNCGEPYRTSVGVYSYPRDLEIIKGRVADVARERKTIQTVLRAGGYELASSASLVPFYIHRFIVCGPDPTESVVLSIHGTDAFVYGSSLRLYLEAEFP